MKKYTFLVVSFFLILITGCRKEPLDNMTLAESNVYITQYDNTIDFGNYSSFRVADSASVISNGQFAGRSRTAFDASLADAVTQAMIAKGFRQETNPAVTPDIGINISKLIDSYTGVVSYDNYWGAYDSYWDPYSWGYGGYNYYFPYSFGVYTTQEGAVSIDMVDLQHPDAAQNRLNSLWTGLARGSGIFETNNINLMVQSFFAQSPYLQQ
ncbi:MAG TPA: DUF4136 domain-containing protein [Ferruginibacter sp.]|jgi:hypothetical protein|nr:DUF4136 domain-containing protein [Ferruginibacter sp.]HPH93048.1 DUF4136 domain-containing protein [Ferruginibacter sp.]